MDIYIYIYIGFYKTKYICIWCMLTAIKLQFEYLNIIEFIYRFK